MAFGAFHGLSRWSAHTKREMNKMDNTNRRLPIVEKRNFCVCELNQVNWSATCAAEDSLDPCANQPIHFSDEIAGTNQAEAKRVQDAFDLISRNVKDLETFIYGLDTALVDASVDGHTKLTMPVTKVAEKIILLQQKLLYCKKSATRQKRNFG